MHSFIKTLTGMAAAAGLGAVLFMGTVQDGRAQAAPPAGQAAAQPEKRPKDTGEFDIFNEVLKDLNPQSPNAQKAITDLNTWAQKYPESDYKDDRPFYYLQAYALLNQPEKVVEYGGQLMNKDMKTIFKDPSQILQVLFRTAAATQQLQNATPEQLAIGEKSAKELLAFVANPASKPAAVTDAQWAEARTKQLEPLANATLVFVAMYPGNQAVAKKEFPAAEQSFRKALQQYPENGWIAYNLGSAIMNEKDPAKISEALYYIARGAAMDPAKGGIADEKIRSTIDAYLKKVYSNYHGSDEGVDQLKQQALASPNPPADFKIKTATDIANEKQQQFAAQYPQLALWMGIKSQLTAPEGESYFATQLKEAAVPKLKGTVMGGKPECRSKEILVAVPEPNQTSTLTAEIALKLDTPLTAKPVAGTEIQWEGVPSAFSKDPFLLTMDAEKAKIEGLKTEPCAVAPARKGAPVRKAVPKKK